MAGKLGAIRVAIILPLYKPSLLSSPFLHIISFPFCLRRLFLRVPRMAQEAELHSNGSEVQPMKHSLATPRSGLVWKHSIDVGTCVIDADYRDPVGVILFNYSDANFEVKVGDRIAQVIIERIMTPEVVEVEDLDSIVRDKGGFGSTGV